MFSLFCVLSSRMSGQRVKFLLSETDLLEGVHAETESDSVPVFTPEPQPALQAAQHPLHFTHSNPTTSAHSASANSALPHTGDKNSSIAESENPPDTPSALQRHRSESPRSVLGHAHFADSTDHTCNRTQTTQTTQTSAGTPTPPSQSDAFKLTALTALCSSSTPTATATATETETSGMPCKQDSVPASARAAQAAPDSTSTRARVRTPSASQRPAFGSVGEFVRWSAGNREISTLLIANNGIAAVKAMRSIRHWAYETLRNEHAIRSALSLNPY